ncbi:MAG: PEP-CTERM sorting domain-containing protein [Tepidisphaeraceae bacterium]
MATRSRVLVSSALAAFALGAVCATDSAHAAFVTPSAGDARFGWSRNDANSTYQEWNTFSDEQGSPGNAPDVGSFNPNGAANLQQTESGAFLTSGGNIYSPTVATKFVVDVPDYDLADADSSVVVAQFRTLGTEPAYDGITLTPDGGTAISPTSTQELDRVALGGFGGTQVDYLARWVVPGNADGYTLNFAASESSMSLDRIAIDTFATVPEPASLASIAVAGGLLLRRRTVARSSR